MGTEKGECSPPRNNFNLVTPSIILRGAILSFLLVYPQKIFEYVGMYFPFRCFKKVKFTQKVSVSMDTLDTL